MSIMEYGKLDLHSKADRIFFNAMTGEGGLAPHNGITLFYK